jgi:enamine deaminase RidA (YjgF/YER057c/UK114 family)
MDLKACSGKEFPLMTKNLELTKPLANYAHTRRRGELVFLAGQGCRDPKTDIWAGVTFDAQGKPAQIDFEAQVRGVFRNIDAALQSGGLTRHHILDVQVFLTDLHQQFSTLNKVWDEYFQGAPQLPTRTTIGVSQLPGLNLVEMKVIASSS